MINHLLVNNTHHPVLLVKYEDLKADTYHEVERMITFLNVELKNNFQASLKEGFHKFHRNHTYTFEHYTPEQKLHMNSVILRVAQYLQYHYLDYLHVDKYLRD